MIELLRGTSPLRRPAPRLLRVAGAAALAALALFAGCREKPAAVKDFGAPATIDGLTWQCHTTFAVGADSAGAERRDFLEVAVHAGDEAKMEWDWLNGDWRPYRNLCFEAATPDGDSLPFVLTVWDGKRDYVPENRLRREFTLSRAWKTYCFDFSARPKTPAGWNFDWSRVRRVIFFTPDAHRPLRFRLDGVRLGDVSLQP